MKKYIKLIRVKHYIKNILIFLPLIFSKSITISNLIICLLGFFAFSFSSSIVYIINDIMDKEKDQKHPIKKNRPIASGAISVKKAILMAITLGFISIILMYFCSKNNIWSGIYILVYLIINIFYSLGLKNIPLLDIAILSLGFIIRVYFGGSLINVEISEWLFLTILSISMYLGLGKRRNELIKANGNETRKVLTYYSKEFLDKNMYVFLSIFFVFYSLWCKDLKSNYMMWTIPIVMIICMKYSLTIEKDSFGDPTEVLLKDKILMALVLLYGISILTILYIGG